jgi:hypothetical protein
MPGADPFGLALHGAEDIGQEAMPNARGKQPGRSKGLSKRELSARCLDEGGGRAAPGVGGHPARGARASKRNLTASDQGRRRIRDGDE